MSDGMRHGEMLAIIDKTVEEVREVSLQQLAEEAGGGEKVALVIVDMVNGFAKSGPLASPRVNALVGPHVRLIQEAKKLGVKITVLRDAHSEESPEFDCFGRHCVKGTEEVELVAELKEVIGSNYADYEKNCLAPGFTHQEDLIVVVGDCTDLCVYQCAMSEKLAANQQNVRKRVVVPVNLVDTYDLPVKVAEEIDALPHDGDFFHKVFLYHLKLNGIELVKLV